MEDDIQYTVSVDGVDIWTRPISADRVADIVQQALRSGSPREIRIQQVRVQVTWTRVEPESAPRA